MRFRRPDGKPAKITLGPFDLSGRESEGYPEIGQPLSLAAARALAAQVHRQRALGNDVAADHKARKHRQRSALKERSNNTFAATARAYVEEHAKPKTRRWCETARLLGLEPKALELTAGGLAQRWREKLVGEVNEHDVWSVVEEARRQGVPGLVARNKAASEPRSRALFSALSSFFGWARRTRRVAGNPCIGLHRPAAPKARDRVLSNEEIRLFWQACDLVGKPFGAIFKLLLLTGTRLNEVAGMRHSELQANGSWHLPGSRTKNRRPHVIPLPAEARALIPTEQRDQGQEDANADRAARQDLCFSTTGPTPPSGWSRAKSRLDELMLKIAHEERGDDLKVSPWRLHDLRRTFVTGLAELSAPPHLIELCVNHISGARGGIAGVYNKSEMLPERKAALELWARFVTLVINRDLHAVHQRLIINDDRARGAFSHAIKEGGELWSRYLESIETGLSSNVISLSRRERNA